MIKLLLTNIPMLMHVTLTCVVMFVKSQQCTSLLVLIQDFSKKQTNYWRIMQSSIKVIVTVHLHPPHHSLKHAMLVMLLQGTTLIATICHCG